MKVGPLWKKIQPSRLRWFEHVERRAENYTGKQVEKLFTEVKRKGEKPKFRWRHNVEGAMREEQVNFSLSHIWNSCFSPTLESVYCLFIYNIAVRLLGEYTIPMNYYSVHKSRIFTPKTHVPRCVHKANIQFNSNITIFQLTYFFFNISQTSSHPFLLKLLETCWQYLCPLPSADASASHVSHSQSTLGPNKVDIFLFSPLKSSRYLCILTLQLENCMHVVYLSEYARCSTWIISGDDGFS